VSTGRLHLLIPARSVVPLFLPKLHLCIPDTSTSPPRSPPTTLLSHLSRALLQAARAYSITRFLRSKSIELIAVPLPASIVTGYPPRLRTEAPTHKSPRLQLIHGRSPCIHTLSLCNPVSRCRKTHPPHSINIHDHQGPYSASTMGVLVPLNIPETTTPPSA